MTTEQRPSESDRPQLRKQAPDEPAISWQQRDGRTDRRTDRQAAVCGDRIHDRGNTDEAVDGGPGTSQPAGSRTAGLPADEFNAKRDNVTTRVALLACLCTASAAGSRPRQSVIRPTRLHPLIVGQSFKASFFVEPDELASRYRSLTPVSPCHVRT